MTRTASCGQENYFYSSEDLSNDETRGWEVWPSPSNIQNDMWNLSRAAHARPTDHKLCSLHITRGWRLQQGNIGSGYKLNNGIISQRGHSSRRYRHLHQRPCLLHLHWHNYVFGNQTCGPPFIFLKIYIAYGAAALGQHVILRLESPVARVHVARVLRSQVFYLSNSFG